MPEIFDISIDGQAFGFLGILLVILGRFPFLLVKYYWHPILQSAFNLTWRVKG